MHSPLLVSYTTIKVLKSQCNKKADKLSAYI